MGIEATESAVTGKPPSPEVLTVAVVDGSVRKAQRTVSPEVVDDKRSGRGSQIRAFTRGKMVIGLSVAITRSIPRREKDTTLSFFTS